MGNRIMIIGNAGGGKSTLAKLLRDALGLPLHQIDVLQWNPGWKPTPPEEFSRRHAELLAGKGWILDGFGPWDSVEKRCVVADTIILVDHPLWVHYWWAMKRQFGCLFRSRPDFVEGCPMLPMTGTLLRMIHHIHHHVRPQLLELVEKHEQDKDVYHIGSPREMRTFIKEHCQLNPN